MKRLLLLFLWTSVPAWAQPALATTSPRTGTTTAEEPVKRANVITLHTTDSASLAYTKLARLLLTEGYILDKTDRELGFINTGYHHATNQAIEVALRFVIVPQQSGTLIEVRGISRMPSMSNTLMGGDSPIEYRGMGGSPVMLAWQAMSQLAASYKASNVTYRRQL
jgi:hypothetical protein